MKEFILKYKYKLSIILVIIVLLIASIILFINNKKDNSLAKIEKSIENIFFYLPESEYNDLNSISDYCKVSMVFGTDYIKRDALLSKEDYNTILKKEKNSVEAYKITSITEAVKSILGDNASINFDANEDGEYNFLIEDNCKYGNDKLEVLNYNESRKYVYSIAGDNYENMKLYVRWEEPEYKGEEVFLSAKALLAIKNEAGDYDVYADNNLEYKVVTLKSNELKSQIGKYYSESLYYEFRLKKIKDDYIWASFKRENVYENSVLVD